MFRELSALASNLLPTISTTMCFGLFLFVAVYLITDRRRSHHRAMEHMPLEDGSDRHD